MKFNRVYRNRWQWWPPNRTTDWWVPRGFLSADEYCNPSIAVVLPPLGCFVLFYRPGPQRTVPCEHDL